MTSTPDTIYYKNQIVINPKTGRPLKVGGKTWLKCVKEGKMAGTYIDDKELKTLPENATETQIQLEKIELDKKLPPGKQAVKGRGKHAGKLVVRDKVITAEEATRHATQAVKQAVVKNIETLALADESDIESMLESMVMEEMMLPNKPPKKETYALEESDEQEEEDEQSEDCDDAEYYN